MLYKERKKRCDYLHLSIFPLKLPVTVLRIRYFHHYSNNYLMKNNADAVYHNVFLLKYYCHFCFDELVAVLDGDVFVVDQEIMQLQSCYSMLDLNYDAYLYFESGYVNEMMLIFSVVTYCFVPSPKTLIFTYIFYALLTLIDVI